MTVSKYAKLLRDARESPEYWSTEAVIEFINDLECLMLEQKIGKADLARLIGTSPSYITKVLGGDANFTLRTMTKLLRPFGHVVHVHAAPEGMTVRWEYAAPADAYIDFEPRVTVELRRSPIMNEASGSTSESTDAIVSRPAS